MKQAAPMNDITEPKADASKEAFFNDARRFPLLSSAEEKQIDKAKWDARDTLLHLFVKDTYCRHYLQQWAHELVQSAPQPEDFDNRQAYLALRREQTPLASTQNKRQSLTSLASVLTSTRYSMKLQASVDTLLTELNVSAVLVAGMAEHLMRAKNCSETGAGLAHWAQSWHNAAHPRARSINAKYAPGIKQALDDYETARNTLVNHNLRLVFFIAGKTQSTAGSFMDRVQSGVLGLIRAAEKFESSKGYRFSTYAFNWINQAIRRSFEDQQGIVRYPSDVSEQISKMYRVSCEHLSAHGREPGELELAKLLKMKPESLFRLRQITDLGVSIDGHIGHDTDGISLTDMLAGDTFASPSARAEQESLNRCLTQSLESLSEQEQRVVDMRWGLRKGRPLTRKELSVHLNMSQERIRQIETNALKKLRHDKNVIEQYHSQ
ncbi:MAG: RNA polymerase sigma factor (sigma-70 family) [Halioglobus sp.]|jgi:RNA polymerase sigma factor (sigma-70 family)